MKRIQPVKSQTERKPSQKRPLPLLIVLTVLVFGGWLLFHFLQKPVSLASLPIKTVLGQQDPIIYENGRVNVLLLGVGGGTHDGADLTDTIIIASYNTQTKQVDLISIPRDLWIDQYHGKVNTLYEIGKEKGNGLQFAREQIGNIVGLQIPYAVKIDFAGFVQAVDLVDGVDVNVEHSFDDYAYPIEGKEDDMCGYKIDQVDVSQDQAQQLGIQPGKVKVLLDPQNNIATAAASPDQDLTYTDDQALQFFSCRYQHLSFKKGLTHMDGLTALEFVRSRHGTNGEGSDFARSKRQQLVLQAFKDKIFSVYTLTDPTKVIALIGTLDQSVETDIPQDEYIEFGKLAKSVTSVKSHVINGSGDDALLINPSPADYGGAWVLIPKNNDFNLVHQYVSDVLTYGESSAGASLSQ